MKNIEFMKEYLEENLVKRRYLHTLGVVETAKDLAKRYGVDIKKAEIAALAHDIAKNLSSEQLLKIIEANNITLSVDEKNTRELWHSIVGPIVARERFGIVDEEILSAIRWHTTGKENMSKLDKIIYLADMIEPSRDFSMVEELRNDSKDDLDKAMLNALTYTIKYLLEKGCLIDVNTVKARNYLLYNNYK